MAWARMAAVMGVRNGRILNIYMKVELARVLDGLDVSCERKKRVQNGSSFGLSSWKKKVVIN